MARELSRQFRAHSIGKTYLALVVHGSGEPGLGNGAGDGHGDGDVVAGGAKTGLITNPLRVDDDGRVRAGVSIVHRPYFFFFFFFSFCFETLKKQDAHDQ
jgi:23S rRNA-/tRNA-specific pseudouridylate synthase